MSHPTYVEKAHQKQHSENTSDNTVKTLWDYAFNILY